MFFQMYPEISVITAVPDIVETFPVNVPGIITETPVADENISIGDNGRPCPGCPAAVSGYGFCSFPVVFLHLTDIPENHVEPDLLPAV